MECFGISPPLEKGEEAPPAAAVDGGVATELLSPRKERRRTEGEPSFYGRWWTHISHGCGIFLAMGSQIMISDILS